MWLLVLASCMILGKLCNLSGSPFTCFDQSLTGVNIGARSTHTANTMLIVCTFPAPVLIITIIKHTLGNKQLHHAELRILGGHIGKQGRKPSSPLPRARKELAEMSSLRRSTKEDTHNAEHRALQRGDHGE